MVPSATCAWVPHLTDCVVTPPHTCNPSLPPQTFNSRPKHTNYQQSASTNTGSKRQMRFEPPTVITLFIWKRRQRQRQCHCRGREISIKEFTTPAVTETTYPTRHLFSIKLTRISVNSSGAVRVGMSSDSSCLSVQCFPNLTAEKRVTDNVTLLETGWSLFPYKHIPYVWTRDKAEQGGKRRREKEMNIIIYQQWVPIVP